MSTGRDRGHQVLAYAVLMQLATEPAAAARAGGRGARRWRGRTRPRRANPAAIEAARTEARAAIEAAWTGPGVASLLRAIGATEAAGYRDRIQTFTTRRRPRFATRRLRGRARARRPRTRRRRGAVGRGHGARVERAVRATRGETGAAHRRRRRRPRRCSRARPARPATRPQPGTGEGPISRRDHDALQPRRAPRVDPATVREGRPGLRDELVRDDRQPQARRVRHSRVADRGRDARPRRCRDDAAKGSVATAACAKAR